jgi:hypothetical protein
MDAQVLLYGAEIGTFCRTEPRVTVQQKDKGDKSHFRGESEGITHFAKLRLTSDPALSCPPPRLTKNPQPPSATFPIERYPIALAFFPTRLVRPVCAEDIRAALVTRLYGACPPALLAAAGVLPLGLSFKGYQTRLSVTCSPIPSLKLVVTSAGKIVSQNTNTFAAMGRVLIQEKFGEKPAIGQALTVGMPVWAAYPRGQVSPLSRR